MRAKAMWGAALVACLALAPGVAWAQNPVPYAQDMFTSSYSAPSSFQGAAGYAPPEVPLPLPLGSTSNDQSGLFFGGNYIMWRQTNPLKGQPIGFRGFLVVDDSTGLPPHTFVGSGARAVDVNQVSGPNLYEPGWELDLGYRFGDGSAISLRWIYLAEHHTQSVVTEAPQSLFLGSSFENTFLFSPVFNFPREYAGPDFKIGTGNPQALYGIWNGASVMSLQFTQRFQQWDVPYRFPVYETECYRFSGLVGPRFTWLWERFLWRTQDFDVAGNGGAVDAAIYTNITSNRMYGIFCGTQHEYYWGYGFAGMCSLECALFLDSVKERAQYEKATKFEGPISKRARHEFTIVPEAAANVGIMWYPTEFIQLQISYDLMAFFNTMASPQPVDFDYSAVNPKWHSQARYFDGWRAGICFRF
jgi:hypothetical protein